MRTFSWFFGVSSSLLVWMLLRATPVLSQIAVDETLGNERSSVRTTIINEQPADLIEGGARRGENLFHSFSDFNVREGQSVYFDSPGKIERILSRVTGSNRSRILGTLGVVGNADLFLLNPNGIIFGPQAQLDVRGSFVATTADSLLFDQDFSFSATDPQAPPLLNINVPIGLQFGAAPGNITNRSIVESNQPLLDNRGHPVPIPNSFSVDSFVGLRVSPGRTLALVGGNVLLPGGELTAPAGRIELGSVAGSDQVSLRQTNQGWSLGYDQVQDFGEIRLSELADVDTTGAGGGAIQLWGDRVQITGGSQIRANTLSNQNGRDIFVHASQLALRDTILQEDGSFRVSLIAASTYGFGRGGDVRIASDQLTIQGGAQIENNTNAEGAGGDLDITADSINLLDVARLNGELALVTVGEDQDGNPIALPVGSGLFVRVNPGATGEGGHLSIVTDRLRVNGGAQIIAETFGGGNAGQMTVHASDIKLVGVTLSPNGEPYTINVGQGDSTFPSLLSTFTNSHGSGGGLSIETQRLSLQDGAVIQATTQSSGDAGNLRINATESVEVAGTAIGLRTPTALLTSSGGIPELQIGNPNATGQGGDLSISTRELTVRDGAVLAVGSLNPNSDAQGSGNLQIQAQNIVLENQAQLTAATNSGDRGNVVLNVEDVLFMRDRSLISARAFENASGGNVIIAAGAVNATPAQDNDIVASAFRGQGGNIIIISRDISGLEERRATPDNGTNDIDASSEFGESGTVITTSALVADELLPVAFGSPEPVQGCQVEGGVASAEFFNIGRGGVPPTPYEPLSESGVLDDVRLPVPPDPPDQADALPATPSDRPIEAQGWRVNDRGEIVLVAESPIAQVQGCQLR